MAPGRRDLKVSVVQGGGLVPVVTTTIADSAALAKQDADKLRAKVDQAGLSSGDPQPNQPAYVVTVDDGARRTRVTLGESDLTPAQRALIDFVGSVPGHEEQIGPLGG